MSVDLSVSSTKRSFSCDSIIRAMSLHKIAGKVTPNTSIMPNGALEKGCTIRLSRKHGEDDRSELKKSWGIIFGTGSIDCAHLQVAGRYDGCIRDYLTDSICPGIPPKLPRS